MARDKRATSIWLCEGPGNDVYVPIEPRNKNIYHKGEQYFRMDKVTRILDDGEIAQCYLWDRYWTVRLTKSDSNDIIEK